MTERRWIILLCLIAVWAVASIGQAYLREWMG
jgi:hypothetical protein